MSITLFKSGDPVTLRLSLLILLLFVLSNQAFAFKRGEEEISVKTVLRPLDLSAYPVFNCADPRQKLKRFGYQRMRRGFLDSLIFQDLAAFPQTKEKPLLWVEWGAGHGLLPLKVYEQTRHAHFIVNEFYLDNLTQFIGAVEKNGLSESFEIVTGHCLKVLQEPRFYEATQGGVDFMSALDVLHFCIPTEVVSFLILRILI